MSDINWELIAGVLKKIRRALRTIQHRFRRVPDAAFFRSKRGRERRDGICMLFQASGESFKQINELSNKTFLARYPEIDWRRVIGFRNIIAHNYFDINEELLFHNCQAHLPLLLETVDRMIGELENHHADP